MTETESPPPVLQDEAERCRGAIGPRATLRPTGLGAVVERTRTVRAIRRSASPKSVVVIDNDGDQVETTVMLLRSAGHVALGSTEGADAVDLVVQAAADVAILDFVLTDMTGGDVCHALRAEPKTCAIKVLIVSGTSETTIRNTCTQYDAYLRKPAEPALFFETLRRL